ncbi:MAG: hypothetical protein FADNKDHG_01118 [Holosporales bacterium]
MFKCFFVVFFLLGQFYNLFAVDAFRIETLMDNAFAKSNINAINGKDVILFLGNTQIGKSTLINYLLGCDYEKKSEGGEKTLISETR